MPKEAVFNGNILLVGFGSIGQAVLPLLLRHFALDPARVQVVTADGTGANNARRHGVAVTNTCLDPGNYRSELAARLRPGDFVVNLAAGVSSYALIERCQQLGALYLDTGLAPWAGAAEETSLPPGERTRYALREQVLSLRRDFKGGPTAIVGHGAAPGLVSHLVKQALVDLAAALLPREPRPCDRPGWARLASRLKVKVIQIAERDTQQALPRKKTGEFVNTWSVDGFVGDACQPAELGWGTHEHEFPHDARAHPYGCKASIYLDRPGAAIQVRSWGPGSGPYHGYLFGHGESISIADYLTVPHQEGGAYRPTVHYAYHPCDDALLSLHELAERNWECQPQHRVVQDEIESGSEELGVLLMGHARGAYWYGARLAIEEARGMAPHSNATALQAAASVVAAMRWALREPHRGIVEPEDLPYDEILAFCRPYLGQVGGRYTPWSPLQGRHRLYSEDVDSSDVWQFKNFRV
ncbi:homospermidine synthase [Caldimonas brevitalea]|uniref:Homospermidine synthase n=1 Tax=Caldimonas brevitalea TaxID=413882 RepID=A0A0G3BNK2_9BURK|nr:saccharopine dehydrogenase NADP-binding domain-containing protein [Caldimonas brevitalea]AKJ28931.1 homospermidine synthase [Caldimonas brevitalea]